MAKIFIEPFSKETWNKILSLTFHAHHFSTAIVLLDMMPIDFDIGLIFLWYFSTIFFNSWYFFNRTLN